MVEVETECANCKEINTFEFDVEKAQDKPMTASCPNCGEEVTMPMSEWE